MTLVETPLGRVHGLMVVKATVAGASGELGLRLALDTGSTETVINPWVVDERGFRDRA